MQTRARNFDTGRTIRASTVALMMGVATLSLTVVVPGLGGIAWAEDTAKGQQGSSDNQGGANSSGNGGQQSGSSQGQGQGGPSADSDGKGPQAGGSANEGGGKPVWAQEGIPEVELGRLNVARSPSKVLDQALSEALKSVNPDIVSFYSQSLEDAITTLSLSFDTVTMYDSPLQSLALLQDVLADGTSELTALGVTNDTATLEALFIGVASDKTVPITVDTVVALTTILGTPITGDAAAQLAADAEAVRIAVLAGHG